MTNREKGDYFTEEQKAKLEREAALSMFSGIARYANAKFGEDLTRGLPVNRIADAYLDENADPALRELAVDIAAWVGEKICGAQRESTVKQTMVDNQPAS